MPSSERIEPLDERGYPVLALWVTGLLLIAILASALTAVAGPALGGAPQ